MKQTKYHDVLEDIKGNGFDADLITIEVGSRGFICPDGFDQLKDTLLISLHQMEKLLVKVSVAAITGSFKIWTVTVTLINTINSIPTLILAITLRARARARRCV